MKMRRLLGIVVLVSLVSCASSQKKLQQAREKDPQYQYNVGLFYLNSNNVDEAIKHLNRSLALNPRYHLALNALGLAQSMKGNLEEAVKHYLRCLEIAPAFSEARNNLGTVYQELGYIDKAEEAFGRVIEDPGYRHKELPYYNLARLSFIRDDTEKALFYVENAIKLNNRFHMGYNLKGLILENKNRLDEAIDSFRQALRIVPGDVNYNFNLGEAHFKNGDFSRALEILEKIAPLVVEPKTKEKLDSYLKTMKNRGFSAA
ncbi:MAG: tetratricopeptide repeat protein [Clostridiales bacterium]|nr:tetratricopeptide repeat protein [Clostridiales bacterium]